MKYTFDGVFLPNIKYGNFISEEGPDVEILVDSSAVPPDQETIIREDENGNCKVFTIQKLNPINAKKIIARINGFKPEEIEIYENNSFVPF